MGSYYKFHPKTDEVVPFGLRYPYPSQATKGAKSVVKLIPKNGSTFAPTNTSTIRLELPGQGYLDVSNTLLAFDFRLWTGTVSSNVAATGLTSIQVQNNIQTIFRRLRHLYGSLVLEDIQDYNAIVRLFTEIATDDGRNHSSLFTENICESNTIVLANNKTEDSPTVANAMDVTKALFRNLRQMLIGGNNLTDPNLAGISHRFTVPVQSGLMNCQKLVPLKWMAGQLATELELEQNTVVFYCTGSTSTAGPVYSLENVNLIATIIEMDSSYDAGFYEAMVAGGIPLKITSFHTFNFNLGSVAQANLQIQERSRSIRYAFAVIRPNQGNYAKDSHAFIWYDNSTLLNSNTKIPSSPAVAYVSDFQWRIGGRYFPSQPVQIVDSNYYFSGSEAYAELTKTLNTVGRYPSNRLEWRKFMGGNQTDAPVTSGTADVVDETSAACFVMAGDFTMSNGSEINGINGEEQNDLYLRINTVSNQTWPSGCICSVFTCYDAMIVIHPGNVVDLIL